MFAGFPARFTSTIWRYHGAGVFQGYVNRLAKPGNFGDTQPPRKQKKDNFKMKSLVTILLFSALCFSQATPPASKPEPKPVAPLTEKEKILVLAAQKVVFQKFANYLQLQKQLADAQTETQNASQEVSKAWQALYDSRKLSQDDAVRCDGPSPGPCAKVATGDIDLVAKPSK